MVDTPRTRAAILTAAADGGSPGNYTLQKLRDLIMSLQNMPPNVQTANYTLALSDAGCIIAMNSATAKTVTIPTNATVAFPIGQKISVMQVGVGAVTIVASGGVTLDSRSGFGLVTGAKWDVIELYQYATDEWRVQPAVPIGLVNIIAAPFRPENYGAKVDGTTNDTTAWTSLISDVTAKGFGDIKLGSGQSNCQLGVINLPDNVSLTGTSASASTINFVGTASSTSYLINASAPSNATQRENVTIADLTLLTGSAGTPASCYAIRMYYAKHCRIERVNHGGDLGLLDAVQLWDTFIRSLQLDGSGQVSGSASLKFRNSAAASGFGFSSDSTNEIYIEDVRTESFVGSGLFIDQGTSNSNNTYGFYIKNFKAESNFVVSDPLISLNWVTNSSFRDLYVVMGGWGSGTTALDMIYNNGSGSNSFDGLTLTQGQSGGIANPINHLPGGNPDTYKDTYFGASGTGPTKVITVGAGATPPIILGFLASFPALTSPISGAGTISPVYTPATQTLTANAQTIRTTSGPKITISQASGFTGTILGVGVVDGQQQVVLNTAATAITWNTTDATSHVKAASSNNVAAGSAKRFTWDSGTSLWYAG